MPSSEAILSGLTAIANEWRELALIWHVGLATLIVALLAGWRPSNRSGGALLIAPVLSVSALAWASGNPFNAAAFAILAVALAAIANRVTTERVRVASPFPLLSGALLVAYGWIYPHFLSAESWAAYTYASPLGLVPCPTLSVLIGVTLILDRLGSTPWCTTLIAAGLVYGAIGVFRLGVVLDYGLLAGTGVLAAVALREQRRGDRRASNTKGNVRTQNRVLTTVRQHRSMP
jgi:hypothetical protein